MSDMIIQLLSIFGTPTFEGYTVRKNSIVTLIWLRADRHLRMLSTHSWVPARILLLGGLFLILFIGCRRLSILQFFYFIRPTCQSIRRPSIDESSEIRYKKRVLYICKSVQCRYFRICNLLIFMSRQQNISSMHTNKIQVVYQSRFIFFLSSTRR